MPSLAALSAIANLIAAGSGLIATNPLNGTPIPAAARFDLTGASGYSYALTDSSKADLGSLLSSEPLPVDLAKLPDDFINAVIVTEDIRFTSHDGLDLQGLAGAALDTLQGHMRGGSGLAQQMVKNALLGPDRTLSRKATEAMLAVRAQSRQGRKAVLHAYLSSAWMGRGLRGVALAPQIWFGSTWSKIDLAQAATLAAMLKGPSYYDPYLYPDRVKARRDMILDKLLAQGWADPDAVAHAKTESVKAIAPPKDPQISNQLSRALETEISDLPRSAPRTGTLSLTIDPEWQKIARAALASRLERVGAWRAPRQLPEAELAELRHADRLARRYWLALPATSSYRTVALLAKTEAGWNILTAEGREENVKLSSGYAKFSPQPGMILAAGATEDGAVTLHPASAVEGAVSLIDPRTGAIIASVGAEDEGLSAFDRTRALRQPGSAVKPFLYLAALESGLNPQSPIEDRPQTYTVDGVSWSPRNYEGGSFGVLPMHTALERSSNTAAAWLASRIGIGQMAHFAEAAGAYAPGEMKRILPSALGATETTLTRMTSGYGTLVNDGIPRTPHLIASISKTDAPPYLTKSSTGAGPIAQPWSLEALLGMMRGVITRGTAATAFKSAPVMMAGKTGTSQDWRDAWFVGVTPQLAAGAWVGRDNSTSLPHHLAGGTAAAPIIVDIVSRAKEAGLIDKEGLRDDMITSGMKWPPEIPANLPRQNAPAAPVIQAPAAQGVGEGSFWGVVSDQRGEDYTKSPPDRNGDIIEMAW